MGVVDAEGRIYGTRCGKAMFEWSRPMYRVGATRCRKRHVHPLGAFFMASSMGTYRGVGGGGGRGRVYLRNPTWDSNV